VIVKKNYIFFCVFLPKIHNMDIREFWNRTNALLKQKGYTQRSLALECGFTERRIESLSTDSRQPTTDESVKIAQVLGVSVEYLATGKNPDNSAIIESLRNHLKNMAKDVNKLR
jgi:transcriptional regulator with XRE-family HTH domain